jgi:hypothetical protein
MKARAFTAGLAALPGAALLAWWTWVNPWFLDHPWPLALVLVPALLGAAVRLKVPDALGWLLALPCVLTLGALLRPVPAQDTPRLLVIGVDGATWQVLDQGEFPALDGLADQGARATLTSMEPLFSPLLWTTMATGKPPEAHGVRGFKVQAPDCQVPRFWDIADAQGLSVGVYKWLVSYPPRQVDGFIVPAWLAPEPQTWPMELSFVKELELANRMRRQQVASQRPGWKLAWVGIPLGLRASTLWESAKWKWQERSRPSADARMLALHVLRGWIDRDVFVHQLHAHNPDVAAFTYYATDGLGHRFWAADAPPGPQVLQAYDQADAIVGELLERVGPDTHVVVLSDHGFQALAQGTVRWTPKTEALEQLLVDELGPLQVSKLGIKLTVSAQDATTEQLQAAIARLLDETGLPFYVTEPVPGTTNTLGLTMRREVFDAERLQTGTVGGLPLADFVGESDEPFLGDHNAQGVLIARGPLVPAGVDLGTVQLLDVGPTLQALMGVAPAQDLSGRVLFGPDTRGPRSRDVLIHDLVWTEGGAGVDTQALEALGYIDR